MFCSFADKENDFTEDDVVGFFEMMLNKNIQSGLFHILSTVFHWQFLKVYIPKGVNLSTWKYEGHSTSQVSP